MSVRSCDKRGSIAARSPNGFEPIRFPNGALRRQRRRPRDISKIIYHAAGQKVACAAVAFSRKSKRAVTQEVFQTLSDFWRNGAIRNARPGRATSSVPNPRPVDPATGRSISPIVAAALCIKPRGMLTANQAAKVDALKKDWPEFATMRRLAMRFRGMLKSKSVAKLGSWLKDAQKSGLYAMQRFARTAQRDIDAVRNAITEPWSNGQTEGQINRLKALKRTMYGRAGPELLRARLLPA